MFLAVYKNAYDNQFFGKGKTLKEAFEVVKEQVEEASEMEVFDQADVEFFESTLVQVEFQIVKKEVVKNVTAVPAVPRKAPARKR